MTREQFQMALRAFYKRRPFLPFVLELASGSRVPVSHPESLMRQGELLVHRVPNGVHSVFSYESITRFIDSTGPSVEDLLGENE